MTSDPSPTDDKNSAPAGGGDSGAAQPVSGNPDLAAVGACPKCKHRNSTDVKFCQKCGTELSQPCPNCNHPNLLWVQHCGSCGVSLPQFRAAKDALEQAYEMIRRRRYDDSMKEAQRGLETRYLVDKLTKVLREAQTRSETLRDLREQAKGLIEQEEYEDAQRVLREAFELDPNPESLRDQLSELAVKTRVRSIEGSLESATAAAEQLNIHGALETVLKAFQLDNKHPRTREMLAQLTATRDRLEATYVEARRCRDNKQLARAVELGESILREWDRADVRVFLKRLQEIRAQLSAHLSRADDLLAQGDYNGAVESLEAALVIDPSEGLKHRITDIQTRQRHTTRSRLILAGKIAAVVAALVVLVVAALAISDHHMLNVAEAQNRAGQYDQALRTLDGSRAVLFEGQRSERLHKEAADVLAEAARQRAEREHRPLMAILRQLDQGDHKPGQVIINTIGIKLVYIPAGELLMGSRASELERAVDEVQHHVVISRPFLLGMTEVTQWQWKGLMGTNPGSTAGDELPVDNVSWLDATEFCRKLSQKENLHYRLPTESEWEYACRAGTISPFAFGQTITTDQANYDGSPYGNGPKGLNRQKSIEVGKLKANAWSLFDMHGNVWEWCSDWYGDYPTDPMTDPAGPSGGTARVIRGGSWINGPAFCRSAVRSSASPEVKSNRIGLRIVLELTE